MVEDTYGLRAQDFEKLREIDPETQIDRILATWTMRPTAYAVSFVPGHEQKVIDYLENRLSDEYPIKEVSLKNVIKSHPGEHFYENFFRQEIGSDEVGKAGKVYIFKEADELNEQGIRILKFANDLFERNSETNQIIVENKIYPLILESITTSQRIFHAGGGNIRELSSVHLTGV